MKFIQLKGALPWIKKDLAASPNLHYVIRVRASTDCDFDFSIYDSKLPLKIPAQKQIIFALNNQK